MKSFRASFVGLIGVVVALAVQGAESSDPSFDKTTLTKIGQPSPVLSIRTVDNQTVDFKGKVVVLNFFATWCGPCMEEMPHLEKELWEPLRKKGLTLIAVGREHSPAEVQTFQKQKKFSFPFAADPKREAYGKFATQYIPRNILIGKDGQIKYQSMGFNKEDFAALIKAVETELGK